MKRLILSGDSAENSIMQTISIAVSAILIAAGLITAPSLINNARDVNAKQDLANIAQAQQYAISDTGSYRSHIYDMANRYGTLKLSTSARDFIVMSGEDCYAVFATSSSKSTFYRTSATTTFGKMNSVWDTVAPDDYPDGCSWPLDPRIYNTTIVTSGNLAAGIPGEVGAMLTPNVTYDGSTWTRLVIAAPMQQTRQRVNLSDLVDGTTYISQWEVANDGDSDVVVVIDWVDNGYFYYTVKPAERRVISANSARDYTDTYRFVDLALETIGGSGILFRNVTVRAAS